MCGFFIVCVCFFLLCVFGEGGFCNMWMCVCVGRCGGGICNVFVCVGEFVIFGCFGNMCNFIYNILYCLYCVFVFFRLCIFINFCFISTSVTTTATG